ncbi:hypothetical protein NADFUDRAFT_47067 [Nadsonia fulvescens var. elongata DSM 6958]|uniref:RING-type domain-containing protein n=1 Tax=Nadsonia fulvescens var. elongata DSM 6958 TaxID=857566 RepID=A0A1E3PJB8_9ASCO|nr:hypothetical protein NADFUDRAFT_47067 [Nadsonia fulvescens var. elongata DSM 6958]
MVNDYPEQKTSLQAGEDDQKIVDHADKPSANNQPEALDQNSESSQSVGLERPTKRPIMKDELTGSSLKKIRRNSEPVTTSTALPELAPTLTPPVPVSTILDQTRPEGLISPLVNPTIDTNGLARSTEVIQPSSVEPSSVNIRSDRPRPRPRLFPTNSARRRRTVLEQLRYVAQQQILGTSDQATGTESTTVGSGRTPIPASVSSERRRVDELLPALLSRALSDSASRTRDDTGAFPPVRTPFETPRTTVDIQSATLSRLLYVTATITANSLLGRNNGDQENPAVNSQGAQTNSTSQFSNIDSATGISAETAASNETNNITPTSNGYGSESFDNFLRDLESGLLTSELLRYMGRSANSGNTENNTGSPQQMNFFRMFRFNSVRRDESNLNADSVQPNISLSGTTSSSTLQAPANASSAGTTDNSSSRITSSATPSDTSEQAEVVPVLVIGIRSHILGNDGNVTSPATPSANAQNTPLNGTHPPANENNGESNISMFDASTSRPLILRRLDQEQQDMLRPTPESIESVASQAPAPVESPVTEPEAFTSPGTQPNIHDTPAAPTGTSYPTYVIYVYGAAYPANHPILTTNSLFSENPTYEDMLLLERFMGPSTRRDVVEKKDLEEAPGVHFFKNIKDTLEHEKSPNGDIKSNKNICPVCWDAYEDENLVRKLDLCGHLFHKDCIDKWLGSCKNNCPMCRGVGIETKNGLGQPKEGNENTNPTV